MEHDRRWARETQASLRTLLNRWDPLGVVGAQGDGGPFDEYDCIVGPLISLLLGGAGGQEVDAYLAAELEDHFGLGPRRVPADVVDQIVAWWASNR